jgi:hypothetical protein
MSNNYLQLSFTLTPTPSELIVLLDAATASQELSDGRLGTSWDDLDVSPEFRAVFPSEKTFLDLFDDPDFPEFRANFEALDGNLWVSSDDADPAAIAELIAKVAPSVLPFGFEWAVTCSKLRPGEFGGGFFVIPKEGNLIGGSTGWLMQQAMEALNAG